MKRSKFLYLFLFVFISFIGIFSLRNDVHAATLKSDTSKLSLNIYRPSASYHKIKLTATGNDLPDSYYIDVNYDKNVVLTSFSDWHNNSITLTVRSNNIGYCILSLYLIDSNTEEVISTYDIPIYVYKCFIKTSSNITVKKGKKKKLKIVIQGHGPDILTVYYAKKGKKVKYKWGKGKKNKFYLYIKYKKKGKEKLKLQLVDTTTGGWILDEYIVKIKSKK